MISWRLRSSHGHNFRLNSCRYLGVSGGREFTKVAFKIDKMNAKAQGPQIVREAKDGPRRRANCSGIRDLRRSSMEC